MTLIFDSVARLVLKNVKNTIRQMNEKNDNLLFLLYNHRELEDALEFFGEFYTISTFSNKEERHKGNVPEGTCVMIYWANFTSALVGS